MSFAKRRPGPPEGGTVSRQWQPASQLVENSTRGKPTLSFRLLAAALIGTRRDQKARQLTEKTARRRFLMGTKSLSGKLASAPVNCPLSTVNFSVFLLVCCPVFLCLCAHAARKAKEQSEALRRSFSTGEVRQYRIALIVRSELEGDATNKIGAKTYVSPFSRGAEETITWRAVRRIVAIGSDGAAEVEEALDNFQAGEVKRFGMVGEDTDKLARALDATLARWTEAGMRTLRYYEARNGEVRSVAPESGPSLGETAPLILTLWVLRALRPAAALPVHPIVFGDRWQEPRVVKLSPWADARAQESGEWVAVPETAAVEPSARLLTVQQISGMVTSGSEKPPEGTAQARFHGESLATLSLSDGHVLEATRSAMREISWTLAPIAGLAKPPEFRARLAVQIDIKECPGACPADDSGRAALRPRN